MVYLVGAGPGDPGLLTLRGAECLARADVVVYDYLANPALLDRARSDAERLYVGKQGGRPSMSQDEINRILVERARAGRIVCRLKGGDPFVFGRGGEEALALEAAGVPFEVVPGVTSAVGATAYAGIPLTHRDLVSTVTFVTGHEDPDKAESAIDWAGLARGGTLVFFMGVKTLPDIVARLVAHGRSPETPAAVIRWGTTPEQETVVGTLADIVERTRARGITPPALTVVGEVVRLRERIAWFERRPLFGRRILVTRAREQASVFAEGLRQAGAVPVEFPTIEIRPPDSWAELDAALDRLAGYDWVVFTSANAVRFVLLRLRDSGRDVRALGRARLCAIGPATAEALERLGLKVDVVPPEYRAEAVVAALAAAEGPDGLRGRRVLVPRARDAREVVPTALAERGAEVDVVTAYRNVLPDRSAAAGVRGLLEAGRIDAVTFTSASTVRNLVEMLGREAAPALLAGTVVAAIGPLTAEAAAAAGVRVDLVPEAATIPALTRALVARFAGESERGRAASAAGGKGGRP
ncbi:MAG TPA: uroporphyrinogen-III C-methyltransferase [Thermodesulfobacteriota bacterium]